MSNGALTFDVALTGAGPAGLAAACAAAERGQRLGLVDGQRVVLAGSGPPLLAVAARLRRHEAQLVGVSEQASCPDRGPFQACQLSEHGIA